MTDKDIEKIQTIDVQVTAESLDAHVICLTQNGYTIQKAYYNLYYKSVHLLVL